MRTSTHGFTLLLGFTLFVALATTACQTAPKELPESTSEGGPTAALYERQPVDIAVLPVFTGRRYEPTLADALRGEVKSHLLTLRFSPLAFEWVDSKLGDFPDSRPLDLNQMRGNFEEDALLYVTLDQWDDSLLPKHQMMIVGLTFSLYDSRTGTELWRHRVRDRTMRLPKPDPTKESATTEQIIADVLVAEALATLPSKDQAKNGVGS